jgi:hypothetical protein
VSTWFFERVTCPACHAEQSARLARGVHASRAPEVRDQLFARTFHRVECRCGAAFYPDRELVYTDFERGHWIQVAFVEHRPRWPELEDACDALFERAFTGAAAAAELRDGFKRRLVFGLEELREKLEIWRASLDDAVVECIKVSVIKRDPTLSRTRLVVDEVGEDRSLVLRTDARPITVPATVVEELRFDPRLRDRFPELFGGRYVSIDRLLGARYRPAEPR